MQNNRIGRRIYATRCIGVGFDENNNKIPVDVTILGSYDNIKRANAAVRKRLGNERILLEKIEVTSKYYSMTRDDFIKHADKVTD